jgi:hypothetical protein
MKDKYNIEDPSLKEHLRENSFRVPDNYFSDLRMEMADKISSQKRGVPFMSVARPQLALVSVFAISFFIIYGALNLFSPKGNSNEEPATTILSENDIYLNEGLIKTTFIDFFYSSSDSLFSEEEISESEEEISEEELISYLSDNLDIVTLSYLEETD